MRTNTEDSGEEVSLFLQGKATLGDIEGVAEVGLSTPANVFERSLREPSSWADANFFDSFEDDIDESDMQT